MDRKKTILIAVMINAGLLAILFIAALSSQDEMIPKEKAVATTSYPLFSEEADNVLQTTSSVSSVAKAPSLTPLPVVEPSVETLAPVVHKLPAPVPEPAQQTAAPVQKNASIFAEVTVKKGDSLDKIAKLHHTTVDEIIQLNQLPGSFLKVGQSLKIPEKKAHAQKPKVSVEPAGTTGPEYYTVKVGDNPWTIAMKHHMKVEELLKINLLNEEKARKLKPGDRLRIR